MVKVGVAWRRDAHGEVHLGDLGVFSLPSLASQVGFTMFPHVRSKTAAFSERDPSSHPLDPETQSLMERQLGRNLGDVRIRSGKAAAASAGRLGAEAYACGRTIVLRHGYRPDTQQSDGRGTPAHVDAATLERTANAAADIVASGGSLPAGFDFGSAPYGMIQRHGDDPCTGKRYNASEKEIWMAANSAIELAYRNAYPRNTIFFGSDFEDSLLKIGPEGPRGVPSRSPWREGPAEVALPNDAEESRFANMLLRNLRGLERQRRPDIVDFTKRAFYEIKSTGYQDRGQEQLKSYYRITEEILVQHGSADAAWRRDKRGDDEVGWNLLSRPYWYPKHVLPMWSPDPSKDLVVCTETTDHTEYPGMIIYEVRRLPRRRRRKRPREIRMYDFWNAYDSFRQAVDASLKRGIPEFDPSSPDYVIIVPDEFLKIPVVRQIAREAMEPRWDQFRVQPEIARRRLIIDPRVTQFWLGAVCIIGGAAIIVVSAGAFAPVAAGAGVVAAETTGVTTAAAATAAAPAAAGANVVAMEMTGAAIAGKAAIIVPAFMSTGTTVVATATEATAVATYGAMLGSATVKAVAATAGVLLLVGSANSAQASTGRAEIDSVMAFRAVPVNDFNDLSGTLCAGSNSCDTDNMYSDKEINEKFSVGTRVFYNNRPHWIFGRVGVR
jgi:hypothetical protein